MQSKDFCLLVRLCAHLGICWFRNTAKAAHVCFCRGSFALFRYL